jgi:hypothetical protein
VRTLSLSLWLSAGIAGAVGPLVEVSRAFASDAVTLTSHHVVTRADAVFVFFTHIRDAQEAKEEVEKDIRKHVRYTPPQSRLFPLYCAAHLPSGAPHTASDRSAPITDR